MLPELVFQRIAHDGLVAALRGAFPPEVALRATEPAIRNGVTVIELTMNSDRPIEAMQAVKRAFGNDAVVGMGTVLDEGLAARALDAGADFLVSPSFDAEVLAAGKRAGILTIPGVITPTEIVQAMRAGATLLKLFPVGPLGVDYFRSIRGPLDQVPMMANGGTTDANIGAFLRAGAIACGMGSWLTGDGAMPADEIARRARRLTAIVAAARTGAPAPQRIVVKVGTSVLTGGSPRLNPQHMLAIVQQTAALHQAGKEVVLVTSAAVAAGRERLGFPELDATMPVKQMLSAVGQSRLMQRYSELYDLFGIIVAQVLLTREDLSHRTRFLNARDTLLTLIDRRIVPIINENDTLATEEIRVGDNDNLSALVATLIEADALIMLTDQDGLYTADPRSNPDARLIERVEQVDPALFRIAGGSGTGLGTGGMVTKLQAAQLATRSGVTTYIASGRAPNVIARLLAGEPAGTRFEAQAGRVESRKRWLLVDRSKGRLHVDAGAARVLLKGGASLLPVGVTAVEGEFKRGANVSVIAPDGREFAHGLASYDAADIRKLVGVQSIHIHQTLGFTYGDAIIHRNNLVLLT